MDVRKAIIPAAGLGTRFLPATKAVPKEMLTLVDKPAIQYIVEEGIRSGIKNFIMVTSRHKRAIEDHFDINFDLEQILAQRGKESILGNLPKLMKLADFIYTRQIEPLGLGHAVWTARHAVGKEPIAVLLPDDIISGPTPGISQLIKVAAQEKGSVIAVREVPIHEVSRYGIVSIKKQFSPNLFQIKSLVEKPSPTEAPSNLAIIGRYVLSHHIFGALEETSTGAGGEIQLTDAISQLIFSGEKVFAYKMQGTHYDIGTPMGWLKANIALTLKRPEFSEEMLAFLKTLEQDLIVMQSKAEMLKKKETTF